MSIYYIFVSMEILLYMEIVNHCICLLDVEYYKIKGMVERGTLYSINCSINSRICNNYHVSLCWYVMLDWRFWDVKTFRGKLLYVIRRNCPNKVDSPRGMCVEYDVIITS